MGCTPSWKPPRNHISISVPLVELSKLPVLLVGLLLHSCWCFNSFNSCFRHFTSINLCSSLKCISRSSLSFNGASCHSFSFHFVFVALFCLKLLLPYSSLLLELLGLLLHEQSLPCWTCTKTAGHWGNTGAVDCSRHLTTCLGFSYMYQKCLLLPSLSYSPSSVILSFTFRIRTLPFFVWKTSVF